MEVLRLSLNGGTIDSVTSTVALSSHPWVLVTYDTWCVCVCMCMYIGYRKTWLCHFLSSFEIESVTEPGARLVAIPVIPLSPGPRALRLYVCNHSHTQHFMWVLRAKLSSSCLHTTHSGPATVSSSVPSLTPIFPRLPETVPSFSSLNQIHHLLHPEWRCSTT